MIRLVYPPPESAPDARTDYPVRLLELALTKAGERFELRPGPSVVQQGVALSMMERGESFDIVWSMTSLDRERRLLPIRIPIYKGLIGWRIAFVSQQHPQLLAGVDSTRRLARFIACQGHDWPDTAILRANGLPVCPVDNYDGLFATMHSGHADYFPRSLAEVWAENAVRARADGLVIDDSLALHYPAAFYFFVNRNADLLAGLIETGLERAIADGDFDTLFYDTYGTYIRGAGLRSRHLIELTNPQLPAETPLDRQALWFRLTDL